YRPFLVERVVDVIMPDVKHCGGLLELAEIAAAARMNNLLVAPHNPAGPLSTAATAQVVSTINNFYILEYAWGEVDWRATLLEPAERIEDGYLILSQEPGLGHRLNRKAIEAHSRTSPFPTLEFPFSQLVSLLAVSQFPVSQRRTQCCNRTTSGNDATPMLSLLRCWTCWQPVARRLLNPRRMRRRSQTPQRRPLPRPKRPQHRSPKAQPASIRPSAPNVPGRRLACRRSSTRCLNPSRKRPCWPNGSRRANCRPWKSACRSTRWSFNRQRSSANMAEPGVVPSPGQATG